MKEVCRGVQDTVQEQGRCAAERVLSSDEEASIVGATIAFLAPPYLMSFYAPVAVQSIHGNINYRIKAKAEP
jgi:hypothetical protein